MAGVQGAGDFCPYTLLSTRTMAYSSRSVLGQTGGLGVRPRLTGSPKITPWSPYMARARNSTRSRATSPVAN
jgi:hypothetical protein